MLLLELPSISCCCVGRESSICNPGFGYCRCKLAFFHHACLLPFPFLFSIHFRTYSSGGKKKGRAKFPSLCSLLTLWHFQKHLKSLKKKKKRKICLKPLCIAELAYPRSATWFTNFSHFQGAMESMFSGLPYAASSPALNLLQLPSMTKSFIYQKAEKLFSKP